MGVSVIHFCLVSFGAPLAEPPIQIITTCLHRTPILEPLNANRVPHGASHAQAANRKAFR